MKITLSKEDIKIFEETLNEQMNYSISDIFNDNNITDIVLTSFEKTLAEEIGKELGNAIKNYTKDNIVLIKKGLKKYIN